MSTLYNKADFRDYIKYELGAPVINVEISDSQIDIIIDDVVQDFQRYNYGEGAYLDYVVFPCLANTSAYSLSGMDIADVIEVFFPTGIYGINQIFSPEHILLQERGGGPGSGPMSNQMGYNVGSVGLEISDYDNAMMYLEEVKRHFAKEYTANYLAGREELRVYPTPQSDATGLLTVYRREKFEFLINNSLVKKLAVARTKIRLGWILSKYNVNMPGGSTINGNMLQQEGKEEEKYVMDLIRQESEPVDFYID